MKLVQQGERFSGKERSNRVDEFIAEPHKAVWKLAVPVMLGMAVQTAYGFTDMIFVGMLGNDAVAALTFNMPLGLLSIGITFGLGAGATSAIARLLGAKDKVAADNAASHALLVGALIGLVIPALGLIFRRELSGRCGFLPTSCRVRSSTLISLPRALSFPISTCSFALSSPEKVIRARPSHSKSGERCLIWCSIRCLSSLRV